MSATSYATACSSVRRRNSTGLRVGCSSRLPICSITRSTASCEPVKISELVRRTGVIVIFTPAGRALWSARAVSSARAASSATVTMRTSSVEGGASSWDTSKDTFSKSSSGAETTTALMVGCGVTMTASTRAVRLVGNCSRNVLAISAASAFLRVKICRVRPSASSGISIWPTSSRICASSSSAADTISTRPSGDPMNDGVSACPPGPAARARSAKKRSRLRATPSAAAKFSVSVSMRCLGRAAASSSCRAYPSAWARRSSRPISTTVFARRSGSAWIAPGSVPRHHVQPGVAVAWMRALATIAGSACSSRTARTTSSAPGAAG